MSNGGMTMKHAAALIAVVAALAAPAAFASCPDQNGPYVMFWGSYYTFTFDPSCASTSGSPSATTMWCYSSPAYQFDGSSGVFQNHTDPAGNQISVVSYYPGMKIAQ